VDEGSLCSIYTCPLMDVSLDWIWFDIPPRLLVLLAIGEILHIYHFIKRNNTRSNIILRMSLTNLWDEKSFNIGFHSKYIPLICRYREKEISIWTREFHPVHVGGWTRCEPTLLRLRVTSHKALFVQVFPS
jgi:hypothetical protein